MKFGYKTLPSSYIGYLKEDRAAPYSKFYNENVARIPIHVTNGLLPSPYSPGKILPLHEAAEMLKQGYLEVENGYTLEADGSGRVAALTIMPGVTPQMWHWWFGWHGSHANRYKLWHPKAHKSAAWKDGKENLTEYIGRTSLIEEYIGRNLEKASIRFIAPHELGLSNNKNDERFICARVGYTDVPLDFGWLVHQVRVIKGGAEMRSRFWIGGKHISIRKDGHLPEIFSKVLRKVRRVNSRQARDLLIHCSEEMNHLAGFLPQLYAEQS